MNIAGVDFTLKHKSIDIYVSGCKGPHCSGCHNPDAFCFDYGIPYSPTLIVDIQRKIESYPDLIDKIMIFGGEPLDQPEDELINLINNLKKFHLDIWLFTRYDITQVPDSVLGLVDYIKTGRYEEKLKCEGNIQYGITLATSNQHIYKKGYKNEDSKREGNGSSADGVRMGAKGTGLAA
jgi:anaerobic ribonucleoside-triphosphate reductase activating protein